MFSFPTYLSDLSGKITRVALRPRTTVQSPQPLVQSEPSTVPRKAKRLRSSHFVSATARQLHNALKEINFTTTARGAGVIYSYSRCGMRTTSRGCPGSRVFTLRAAS